MIASGVMVYRVRRGLWLWAICCLSLGLGSIVLSGVGFLAAFFGLPAARAVLLAPISPRGSAWTAVAAVVSVGGPWLSWYGLRLLKMYLVVSAKGVEYHGLGKHVYARWHEVDNYDLVTWGGFQPAAGLRLRSQAGGMGIPLELFAANWPLSPLGQTVHYYLPRLNGLPAVPPAPLVPRRRNHRRSPASPPPPAARPAITQRLRPLRPPGDAVPGEWQGDVTGRLAEHDGDTIRF